MRLGILSRDANHLSSELTSIKMNFQSSNFSFDLLFMLNTSLSTSNIIIMPSKCSVDIFNNENHSQKC